MRLRDMIAESLADVIVSRHGADVLHNIHMQLKWEPLNNLAEFFS